MMTGLRLLLLLPLLLLVFAARYRLKMPVRNQRGRIARVGNENGVGRSVTDIATEYCERQCDNYNLK